MYFSFLLEIGTYDFFFGKKCTLYICISIFRVSFLYLVVGQIWDWGFDRKVAHEKL